MSKKLASTAHFDLANLRDAVEAEDIAEVKRFLAKGTDPDETRLGNNYNCEVTLLNWCVQRGKLEMAKILINAGASLYSTKFESSALYHAIDNADIPMIRLLAANGAEFGFHDGLTTAIRQQQIQVVQELIELGADVNTRNGAHELPIMWAIVARDTDILKLLIENKANVNVVDETGNTLLMEAVRLKNFPVTQFLLQNEAQVNARNAAGETPLSIALSKYDFRTFKLLIASGADPGLASHAIEELAGRNPDFAAYMATLDGTKNFNDQTNKGFTDGGHEAC